MEALSVVEFFYEFRDVAFGVLMAFIFLLSNPFALQTSEEAFDHGVSQQLPRRLMLCTMPFVRSSLTNRALVYWQPWSE